MYHPSIDQARLLRRVVFCLGLLCMPAIVRDSSIVVGNHLLQPNQAGQKISLYMTGNDEYTDGNFGFLINGGLPIAPVITHVFGHIGGAIPTANLAGSIWEGGQGGVGATFPD